MNLLVIGVTEKHGRAWDLICEVEGLSKITVDPFVSSAWPARTDLERRAMIGKRFIMENFQVAKDGCYLPEIFYEPTLPI